MGAPRFVLDRFWPSNLFLGGIPGAWYDPTDLSTMFQDSTGTTPVTAVEQPVGLILDKSQGLALGAELVTNGNFSSGTTGWTAIAGATLSIDAGRLKVAQGLTDFVSASQGISTIAGRTYKVTFDLISDGTSSPSFVVYARQFAGSTNIAFSSSGFGNGKSFYFTAVGATTYIEPGSATSADNVYGLFDNVSVVEIAGNHASQSTAASRPTYRARYNLLTFSEQFDDAAWVKDSAGTGVAPVVTPNAGTAPDGTTTADRVQFNRGAGTPAFSRIRQTASAVASTTCTWSVWMRTFSGTGTQFIGLRIDGTGATCTVTGTWQRFQISATSTAADCQILSWTSLGSDQTADLLVWGAQLLTAADVTATGNAYQRIAAATVYDTAPIFRPYLAFDGVDDLLSTAAINFTSTDKMTVFAGVTKLSTATFDIAVLSADWTSNNGTFGLGSLSPNGYFFGLRGTAFEYYAGTTFTAPATNVLTASYDIAGAAIANEIVPRVNATTPTLAPNGGPAGTGNFGTHVLNISRALVIFNGRLYSLIVRGAASSVTEIADTELWVNARTGAY